MQIEQISWSESGGWLPRPPSLLSGEAQLVLVFGGKDPLIQKISELKEYCGEALLVGCSTSGEIHQTDVRDNTLTVVAVCFESTMIRFVKETINGSADSYNAGKKLVANLEKEGLVHLFVLSNGLNVNGSELTRGLTESLCPDVAVTGGLAGDGDRFEETFIVTGDCVESNVVVGVGFYGKRLKIGYGSLGGWDVFGMNKTITRSEGNILYELDGNSALEVYKKYLGDMAEELPASGLLFPLEVWPEGSENPLVRTILGIDEKAQSLVFAGDVPTGAKARFMKANFSRLVDGAVGAAQHCVSMAGETPELAILISCVGRKLILKQRTEEEVEGVLDVLGPQAILTGFYSYGELSPSFSTSSSSSKCELHNQTMTITTFREI